jgi:type IV pilus assembly protein PilW
MYKQRGLSLIELMISITIGLILMTGVVQLFLSSRVTFATQQAMSRVQETGRLAMDFMAQDIRMAGYMGCATRGATTINNGLEASTDFKFNFDEPLMGYTAANSPLTADNVAPNTDVLIVRHAGSNAMPIVEDTNHGGLKNANLDVAGSATNHCASDLCKGDIAIISDCAQGRIFRVTNLTSASGVVRIEHAPSGTSPKNSDSKLGGQQFGAGAEIIKMSTVAYYISESATTGELGLWQRVGDETYELLEGVQDMSLRYGVGGTYYTAAAVPNWDEVNSIRVELLVQSVQDNVVSEPQPYTFEGQLVTPTDRRMRQVFSSTVAIRNRLQ